MLASLMTGHFCESQLQSGLNFVRMLIFLNEVICYLRRLPLNLLLKFNAYLSSTNVADSSIKPFLDFL